MFIDESVHHPGLGRLLLLPVGLRKKTAEMLSCPAGPSPTFNFVPCDALHLVPSGCRRGAGLFHTEGAGALAGLTRPV